MTITIQALMSNSGASFKILTLGFL